MTSRTHYEALVASLPYLPRFDRTGRLPINAERLQGRLRMLSEADAALLAQAVRVIEAAPEPTPTLAAASALLEDWQELLEHSHEPALRALLRFHADVRTVLSALRRRRLGLPPFPLPYWPAAPWMRHVVLHWDDPEFKLAPVFPWIGEARGLLQSGNGLALERLLGELEWRLLDSLGEPRPFSFAAVLAYRFKWGLLQRWLAYDEAKGQDRFEHLIAEVRGEEHPDH